MRSRSIHVLVMGVASLSLLLAFSGAAKREPIAAPQAVAAGDAFEHGYSGLTQQQKEGRDTWYFWTGGDLDASGHNPIGGQELWRILAVKTHGEIDLLQAVDSRYRAVRFKRFGVINDPDCSAATAPDEYGLWLDVCSDPRLPSIYGQSAGIVGLRTFRNSRFNEAAWNLQKYLADPSTVEPPYLIGMSCAFCHAGFNPQHPPADPENPKWSNVSSGIGNQYLKEQLFHAAKYPPERELKPDDFAWQVANVQPPGTSDISEVATDHINNPTVISIIANVNARPRHDEQMLDGSVRQVYHVLVDGADSIGSYCLDDPAPKPGLNDLACGTLRGYVNIGICADVWTDLHDAVAGFAHRQSPFVISEARKNPACGEAWQQTLARLPGLEAFLRTLAPPKLADADGGAAFLPASAAILARGKIVFAEHCAACHSSKLPPPSLSESQKLDWFRQAVQRVDFLTDNYLSDDARHPDSEIGTNSARALSGNATAGHIWAAFSSESYKALPPVDLSGLADPIHRGRTLPTFHASGGRGYYRTPTLAGLWATAPFLHNNSVGAYNADPSVAGRISAYEDAMTKLLSPELRDGLKSIRRATQASVYHFEEGGTFCVGANTPIALMANLPLGGPRNYRNRNLLNSAACGPIRHGMLNEWFLARNNAPDFVEDEGHTFGSNLSADDKKALIEYMKTF